MSVYAQFSDAQLAREVYYYTRFTRDKNLRVRSVACKCVAMLNVELRLRAM